MTTPNLPPENKPVEQWTVAERDAFYADQNARQQRIVARATAALAPWAEVSAQMTHRQWYAIEGVIRLASETVDYFGNTDFNATIKIECLGHGRKHSPNRVWTVRFDLQPKDEKAKMMHGAMGHAFIGKRAKVTGSIWDTGVFGREKKLGKARRSRKTSKAS